MKLKTFTKLLHADIDVFEKNMIDLKHRNEDFTNTQWMERFLSWIEWQTSEMKYFWDKEGE